MVNDNGNENDIWRTRAETIDRRYYMKFEELHLPFCCRRLVDRVHTDPLRPLIMWTALDVKFAWSRTNFMLSLLSRYHLREVADVLEGI